MSCLVTPALTVAPLEPKWGKVSLLSKFIGGTPMTCFSEIHKTCSLCIISVNLSSLCVDRAYLSTCHIALPNCIRFCLRRKALRSLRSELYIVWEVVVAG